MKKRILTIGVLLMLIAVSFGAGLFTSTSHAIVPIPFGGRVIMWVPCTCTASFWIVYQGLPDSPFIGGALGYVPYTTLVYSFYNMFTLGVWHMGRYAPGVQSCWMYVGTHCQLWPVLGTEIQVGTSATPSAS